MNYKHVIFIALVLMLALVVPACLHEWEYDGKSKHGATCPMCRKFVKFTEQPKEEKK